jgi:hypothetical protein
MPHDYTTTREQTVADTLIAGTDLNCVSLRLSRKGMTDRLAGHLLSATPTKCLLPGPFQPDEH